MNSITPDAAPPQKLHDDPFIMVAGVDIQKTLQPVDAFGRAPGATRQAFDVVADHGAGVVQGKQWIKPAGLELALPDHTAAATFVCFVNRVWHPKFHSFWVAWALI